MASVSSEISERMPLQASATSRLVLLSMMTLPSRSTGTPASIKASSPNREARSCNGKAIWLKMIAGIGIISSRNASGNARIRRYCQPYRNRTTPVRTPRIEMRVRNSSAPRTPAPRTATPPRTTNQAQVRGPGHGLRQSPAPFPHQVDRDRHDEEAVGVVVVGAPVVHQLDDDVAVENGKTRRHQRESDQMLGIPRHDQSFRQMPGYSTLSLKR